MTNPDTEVGALYEQIADWFDENRGRDLREAPYLARIVEVHPQGMLLDIGCGAGDPVATYFIERGWQVTGVDISKALLAKSQTRFPAQTWLHADMRGLQLERRFDAVIAWDSFFHLTADAQRDMLPTFAAHLKPGGLLLFNTGPAAGTVYGQMQALDFHHASLDVSEYRTLLANNGFIVMLCDIENPDCGGRTVWLAQYMPPPTATTAP